MQDENIKKMAERADTVIKDVPTINILLCYLLSKLDKPVEPDQLYDIAIATGHVNFFSYQDSVDHLLKNKLVTIENTDGDKKVFVITEKGLECAKQLKNYVSKSYRDKLVLEAKRYFTRLKNEQQIKIDYIELENGYYTHVRCLDVSCDLMDLKLYAPDLEQAKMIGERIMRDPVGFYGKIVELALTNEEQPYDLTDN